MRLSLAGYVLSLGVAGLLLFSAATWDEPSSPFRSESIDNDTTGARLLIERQGQMLRIQGVFINDSTWTGTLTYELNVQRTGNAGTSQSIQSGRFKTAPGQTDTLSTMQINVQSGDEATLHLVIRWDETVVGEVRRRCTF